MSEVYVKNTNGHGIRGDGVRVPAGGVAKVDGDGDLAGYAGVEKVTKKEYDAYRKQGQLGGGSHQRDRHEELKRLRQEHRMVSTAAPLQVVVGDDDAPYGPPTGTVTTKQTEAKKGPEEKRRFADHEQAEVPEGASEVEQRQAENVRAAEEVAQKLAAADEQGSAAAEEE